MKARLVQKLLCAGVTVPSVYTTNFLYFQKMAAGNVVKEA
jgi:hypothetical protein